MNWLFIGLITLGAIWCVVGLIVFIGSIDEDPDEKTVKAKLRIMMCGPMVWMLMAWIAFLLKKERI